MDGFQVMTMDDASKLPIFLLLQQVITKSLQTDVSRIWKDKAIVCNIGHFDNEINMAWLNENHD